MTSGDGDRTLVLGPEAREPAPSRLHQNALPVGARLGEFEILDLVGEGGFGIVYLAEDHSLHRKVALKEYMPALLASRGHDASVSVRSERQRETFDVGLRSFVNEARMLAQFDHPALVKVYRFWEANGTAYMVMPFFSGQTLQDALKARGEPPGEVWIRAILSPIMDAVEVLHEGRVYHRDIAPDNIMLLAGDRPVLLDFGAARHVISGMTHALTAILKPGYAPLEQYADMPGMKQGPWTDVYAMAAVVYSMILERKPPPAVSRVVQDSYEPLVSSAAVGRYSARLLQGVDKCLSVRAEDRPQSIAAMREALGFTPPPAAAAPPPPEKLAAKAKPAAPGPSTVEGPTQPVDILLEADDKTFLPPATSRKLPMVAAAVVLLAALAGGLAYYQARPGAPAAPAAAPVAAAPAIELPAPPPVTPPAAPPAPRIAGLSAAVDAALAAADSRLSLALEAPRSIAVGDDLKLVARSKSDGLLYLFVWDQATDRIYRPAPGGQEGGQAIKAGGVLAVTHKDAATAVAKGPAGSLRVVSMLSERPRDFSAAAFVRDGDVLVGERGAIEATLAANGLPGLFGTPQCAAGETCQDRFAIGVADVAREAAPPPPALKRAAAPKTAAPAPPRAPAPGRKAPDSEREYMKRLNKDLDKLLGK